jgi:hypothetical protein
VPTCAIPNTPGWCGSEFATAEEPRRLPAGEDPLQPRVLHGNRLPREVDRWGAVRPPLVLQVQASPRSICPRLTDEAVAADPTGADGGAREPGVPGTERSTQADEASGRCGWSRSPGRYCRETPTNTSRGPGSTKANDGGRTRDLRLGKPTLYQLSYVRAALLLTWISTLALVGDAGT